MSAACPYLFAILYPHNFPSYFDMLPLLFSLNCEAAGTLRSPIVTALA
jgi:hypothetical protein